MSVRGLDTLLAMKVLGLVPSLTANDRRVGAVLIDHFNRRTGRCDPGLARIAGLLGISERTVIRCNHRLERVGLFRKIRHGGYSNRNSYEPIWNRFLEYENSWQSKMKRKPKSTADLSPARGQPCHVAGDSAVTQTCSTNLSKSTYSRGLPKKELEGRVVSAVVSPPGKRSADAAYDDAERRWTIKLDQQFRSQPITYAEIIDAITPELRDASTRAELASHGAGLRYITQRLKLG